MPIAYAPPVSSPPFFFYPPTGFYVVIGHTVYPQASSDRIHSLVTYNDPGPVLNKAGKPKKHQPPPHQDESTRFYMAQLQLYGLEPVNSKKAAKKALLAALQGPRGLCESDEVDTIHMDMCQEYREKDRAAEEEHIRQRRLERFLRKEAKAEETKKRQREEAESGMQVQAPSSKKTKSNKVRFGEEYHTVFECSSSCSEVQRPRYQQAF